ncbi:MAG: hypothetical protein RCG15_00295 [Candidatus Rickettsia vulgarisii]
MYDFVDDSKALEWESQQQFNRIPWFLKNYWLQKQVRRIIRPDVLGCRFNINQKLLEKLIWHGYPIISWTVDDPNIANSLYKLGVKGIQSNRPQFLKELSLETIKNCLMSEELR